MSDRDRVRTTFNVYGADKKATCENAIETAKSQEGVESTSEAMAEICRAYTGWSPEDEDADGDIGGDEEEPPDRPSATDGGRPMGIGSLAEGRGRLTCKNCGGAVTEAYIRVFAPTGVEEGVRVCPRCPDKIRGKNGHPRAARSTRRNGAADTTTDHSRREATTDVE